MSVGPAGSSRTALHVLRLLWTRTTPSYPARHFSAAVLCPSDYPSSDRTTLLQPSSYASGSHASSSSSSTTVTTQFLEDGARDREYKLASLLLNPSEDPPTPLPWPTIFPPLPHQLDHPHAQIRPQERTHRCDPLARHVAIGDLETAKIIYGELKALHIGILHRQIYLDAAISRLDGTAKGKEDFLFWLSLVPNKPATRPHPKSKAIWSGAVERILELYTQDVGFITEFLEVTAKKGSLPDVLGPMVRHLAMLTPPDESRVVMDGLMASYRTAVTSPTSPTRRAEKVRSLAQNRVSDMWKAYLSALQAAGWQAAAAQLLAHPPQGVAWSSFTINTVDRPVAVPTEDEAWKGKLASKPTIVRHVIRAKRESIKPALLADIIGDLRADGRGSLIERLERRYVAPSVSTPWRRETWFHALLLSLSRRNHSKEAVELFAKHFMWIGLPSMPSAASTTPPSTGNPRKLYPSKGVITTILPRILALLPGSTVAVYHSSYLTLSQSVSPKMGPTPATHSALLRSITHLLGPDAGVLALRRTLEAGYEPGLAAYTALLCSLAGNNRLEGMVDLLRDMEHGMLVKERKMPTPTRETYLAIAGVLDRAGQEELADAMRARLRQVSVVRSETDV